MPAKQRLLGLSSAAPAPEGGHQPAMRNQVAQTPGGEPGARSPHPLTTGGVGHDPGGEPVVLLDALGRPSRTVAKSLVHHDRTPLHLGFSCHVVTPGGLVLLARRAAVKRTWPATWSNACCGHPGPGETLRRAVERRLRDELGLVPRRMAVAVPDFAYRAVMDDGTVEHELCPVVVAEVDREPRPDPDEVDAVAWVAWVDLCARVDANPRSLSPWAVEQVRRLAALAPSPLAWLDARVPWGTLDAKGCGLDRPAAIHVVADAVAGGIRSDPVATVRAPVERAITEFLVRAAGGGCRPRRDGTGGRRRGATPRRGRRQAVAARVRLLGVPGHRRRPRRRRGRGRGGPRAAAHVRTAPRRRHGPLGRTGEGGRPHTGTWPTVHRCDGLDGDDGWFGVSGAVLAGDLAFLWSTQLLGEAPLSPDALARGRRCLRPAVHRGDRRPVPRPAAGGRGRPLAQQTSGDGLARQVALLKSARYTVTRPLQLGAALAGPGAGSTRRCSRALATYGDAVGLAFQLRDDVLGLFGEPDVTGKSRLDDLREGKRTLLVVRALHLAPGHGRPAPEPARSATRSSTRRRPSACREIVADVGGAGLGRGADRGPPGRGGRRRSGGGRSPPGPRSRRWRPAPPIATDDGGALVTGGRWSSWAPASAACRPPATWPARATT